MVSREKWEESVEAWAWVFRLLQVLEGTTTKTKATYASSRSTTCQGFGLRRRVGNAKKSVCVLIAKPYGPGLKIRLR